MYKWIAALGSIAYIIGFIIFVAGVVAIFCVISINSKLGKVLRILSRCFGEPQEERNIEPSVEEQNLQTESKESKKEKLRTWFYICFFATIIFLAGFAISFAFSGLEGLKIVFLVFGCLTGCGAGYCKIEEKWED